MLWLLPPEAGPVRVRLDPGVYVVPRWYDAAELGVLIEVLRRVLDPTSIHAVMLPTAALETEVWRGMELEAPTLFAVRGDLDGERRSELGRWARERRHHLLVSGLADDDELASGWLERSIKPAIVWLLERGAWVRGHPLAAFGIEGLEPHEVARATEDPIEMLWLVERMLGHRLRHAEQGTGRQDYARSLGHAVGKRCAEKLRRHASTATAALDVIVCGAQSKDGWAALVGAGLGAWREGVFVHGPLLRMLERERAILEVMVEDLGPSALSELARESLQAQRRAAQPQLVPSSAVLRAEDAYTAFDGQLLASALREGLREAHDAPPLLGEAVEAIGRWEAMRWSRDALERLRSLLRELRGMRDLPSAAHRWFAKLTSQVLTIVTATRPSEARSARKALRRLLSEPLAGWELDVWLNATLECARIHRNRAENHEDVEHGVKQLLELTRRRKLALVRPWHVAEAFRHTAEAAMARGDLDIALHLLKDDSAPVFEQLGDRHSLAIARNQLAMILHAKGALDDALGVLQAETLPSVEPLGDERLVAMTKGVLADVLEAKGDVDQALDIRQHCELPTYERLGDERSRAITLGKIANTLASRGDLDAALQIHQDDEIPAYERLGDVLGAAITRGEIAAIFEAKGDIDEALRIRRHDELPVYERLGYLHLRAGALVRTAVLRLLQKDSGARDDASRMLSEAHQAYTRLGLPAASAVEGLAASLGLELD